MGRKRKSHQSSYTNVISSSYVRKSEYEKAQITYSNMLDENGNVKSKVSALFLGIEDEDHWGDDEIYD